MSTESNARAARSQGVFLHAFRIVLWFESRHRLPTWQEVVDQFGVSRSSAHRYLRAWKDAKGMP